MQIKMNPGQRCIVVPIDAPYANDVYEAAKRGEMAVGAWEWADIAFDEWIERVWPDALIRTEYEAALARVHQVMGTRTQVQLADALGIRQSSISDSKRRSSIPDSWLLTILRMHRVNPEWIRTGRGARYLTEAES